MFTEGEGQETTDISQMSIAVYVQETANTHYMSKGGDGQETNTCNTLTISTGDEGPC